MTPEERKTQQEKIEHLCLAIINEKDPDKLTKLVAALNELLQRRDGKNTAGAT